MVSDCANQYPFLHTAWKLAQVQNHIHLAVCIEGEIKTVIAQQW